MTAFLLDAKLATMDRGVLSLLPEKRSAADFIEII